MGLEDEWGGKNEVASSQFYSKILRGKIEFLNL